LKDLTYLYLNREEDLTFNTLECDFDHKEEGGVPLLERKSASIWNIARVAQMNQGYISYKKKGFH